MNEHELIVSMAKRLLEYDEAGITASADEPYRNATETYTDLDLFDLEMEKIFKKYPQLVCFSSDMPKPGDFRTFNDLGVPILITRDSNGKVNAFLNTCSHRGATLKEGPRHRRTFAKTFKDLLKLSATSRSTG